ncbi:MAG: hypothetical protein WDM89_04020 [Rhizomicrobium sp.]
MSEGSLAFSEVSQTKNVARSGVWMPVLAFIDAAVLRMFQRLNADVSWDLMLDDKILDGAKPYRDFLEVNPPATFWLYMPASWGGRVLGITPEFLVSVLVFTATIASLWLCGRILRRARLLREEDFPVAATAAILVLLALPSYAFGERDHIALIATLPLFCIYAARASNGSCGIRQAILAGIGGGIAVAIKFYFALALVLPFLFVLWRHRRDRGQILRLTLSPENLTVGIITAVYLAIVFVAYPDFDRNVLPLVLTVYVPASVPYVGRLTFSCTLLWIAGAGVAILVAREKILDPLPMTLLLASLGYVGASIIQGKDWAYHGYPGVALIILLSGWLLLQHARDIAKPAALGAALLYSAVLALATTWFAQHEEVKGLRNAVADLAPPRPKIIAVTDDMQIIYPLVREAGATWVGRTASQWIPTFADYIQKYRDPDAEASSKIEKYVALNRSWLVEDVRTNRPDVILIDGEKQHASAFSIPALRAELAHYRNARTVGGVEIWLRVSS